MKRLVRVMLIILALILVLTVPVAATTPTDVSGKFVDSAYTRPLEFNSNGPSNCRVTVGMWHEWGDGSFRGRSVSEWRILAHGPCVTSRPGMNPANLTATGTFTGDLCLGAWEGDVCRGEKYSGSFDFRLQWHLTNPEPDDWTVDTFAGSLVILQGYGGFEGLHGVLEQWGRTGPKARGGRADYVGQVHLNP